MTKKKSHGLENLALISHMGIIMIVPIIIGLYLGKLIDDKFNTGPLFLFIFIIMGVISGFRNMFKLGLKDSKNKGK